MSNTLDKLKALNDKLEAKLSEQVSDEKKDSSGAKKTKPEVNDSSISEEEVGNQLLDMLGIDSYKEPIRANNIRQIAKLYVELRIYEKAPEVDKLFIYKAMNISAISLKEEDFGEIREGKYVQVIAITYEPDKTGKKKAKNISLGYFGKAETLDEDYKNDIIEFVLRWRYEKAFQNLEHYKDLIDNIRPQEDSLF